MKNEFIATIGIECHVQLKTITKLFSAAVNDAREAEPNTLINHIDVGLPGALPFFNEQALVLATRAAIALNTRPQFFSKFDRKHYFYPDLPMGYQITQYDQPIIIGGKVDLIIDDKPFSVGITRAHLESDAGKSMHPIGQDYSLVDLNRAGTPLLEIVSEPDMHSAIEAKEYAKELYLLMRNADVTDGDLFHGNMRFDVNVSISKNNELGTRTETKNLNSFRSVEKAVEYEIKRQKEVINNGGKIIQETRGWNDAKQKTFSQRTKENADDYRYMPDPDLPPLIINDAYIDRIVASMPISLSKQRSLLRDLGLVEAQIDVIIENNINYPNARYLELITDFNKKNKDTLMLVNWIINIDIPHIKDINRDLIIDRKTFYEQVILMINDNKLNSTNAKELINKILEMDHSPTDIEAYATKLKLIQQSNEKELIEVVKSVIKENPKAFNDLKQGETKVVGFLIGQIMKKTNGQANPSIVKKIIDNQIKE